MGLVLASRSPQRRAILSQLGIPFTVRPADIEEDAAGDPEEVVAENARRKARAVAGGGEGTGRGGASARGEASGAGGAEAVTTVLGVDTVVVLDGTLRGKPPDAASAREVLAALGGRTHRVVSGLALLGPDGAERIATDTTQVAFRPLDDAWLDWYVALGEWRERAGGYAIQGAGAALVRSVTGDYLNVVGLPVTRLLDLAPELLLAR
jgi:septum formation protein